MAALTTHAIVSTHPQVALPELVHGENAWLVPRGRRSLERSFDPLASDDPLRSA